MMKDGIVRSCNYRASKIFFIIHKQALENSAQRGLRKRLLTRAGYGRASNFARERYSTSPPARLLLEREGAGGDDFYVNNTHFETQDN